MCFVCEHSVVAAVVDDDDDDNDDYDTADDDVHEVQCVVSAPGFVVLQVGLKASLLLSARLAV